MASVSHRSAARTTAGRRWTAAFFAAAIALFAVVTLGMSALPIAERNLPPGGSDAYSYISKARVMRDCLALDCRAMAELRAQVAPNPAEGYVVERARWMQAHRAVYWYHPLHSAALLGLKAAGLSWEGALNALAIAGAAATVLGIAWFLVALVGVGPAAFGLVVLAFTVHPGFHGIHWFVPSNIALGLAFGLWAALLARLRGAVWWLPVAALLLVGLHPVGKILVAMALALHLYLEWREKAPLRPMAGTAAATALAVLAPEIVGWLSGHPGLDRPKPPWPDGMGYFEGLAGNVRVALDAIGDWLAGLGGWAAAPFLAAGATAFMIWDGGRARPPAVMFLAAAAGSLVFVLPHYEAELFVRMWVPAAVVLAGLLGHAMWQLIRREGPWRFAGVSRPVRLAVLGLAAVLASEGGGTQIGTGAVELARTYRTMATWVDTRVDHGQPGRLDAFLGPGERVLFLHEYPLYHFLTYGPLDRGLVYGPAVAASARADDWLVADAGVRYGAIFHPAYYGWVPLVPGVTLHIEARQTLPEGMTVRLVNRGAKTDVLVAGADTATVPAGWVGWLTLPTPPGARTLRLSVPRGSPALHLTGLRLAPGQRTHWPWERGVRLLLEGARRGPARGPNGPFAIALGSRLPPACSVGGVVEDFGGIVLFETMCVPADDRALVRALP